MAVHVTHHAIDRYIERVEPIDRLSARERILGAERGIRAAASIGGRLVRLPSGARLVVRGRTDVRVVTVLGRDQPVAREPAAQTVCCGVCSLRCSHPLASSCTRADCGLANQRSER